MKVQLAALAVAALLAGCGSSVDLKKDVPVESRTPTATNPGGDKTAGGDKGQSAVKTVEVDKGGVMAPSGRVIYFDFDSYVIKDEFKPLIDGHAKALTAARGKRIVVEGHTDERGGREYNLALGQKRAEAVVKSLALLGVGDNQMEATSFGKERPAVPGSDEAAWAKNRRAELKDR